MPAPEPSDAPGPATKRLDVAFRGVERWFEAFVFWARWILAPAYVVLCGCLVFLLEKVGEEFYQLFRDRQLFAQTRAIAQVLIIVDLVLVMNLILMVLFVGYVNFVSKIHPKRDKSEDWPKWMGHLDYSGLKVQVLGSIIAVSSISILRLLVELADDGVVDQEKFLWIIALHITFLLSALTVAVVNRLKVGTGTHWEDDKFSDVR